MRKFYGVRARMAALGAASLCCLALLAGSLYPSNIPPSAVKTASDSTVIRTLALPAARGGIYDRNGIPLVTNSTVYSLRFDYFGWQARNCARVIRDTLELLSNSGIVYRDKMPLGASPPYTFTAEPESTQRGRFRRFLRYYGLPEDLGAEDAVNRLAAECGIPADFDEGERRAVLGVLFDLCIADFSAERPYTLASGVGIDVVSVLTEQAARFPGVIITQSYIRRYETEYAAHVLGTVGVIPAAEADKYETLGYPADALVGRDGAERAFETYLRGTDGEVTRELTLSGGTVRPIAQTSAVSGADVYLTLDITLQGAAEDALENRILTLRGEGIAAEGGAAVAVDVKTGEILALASYPSYSLEDFYSNYTELASDPLSPLYNRAIAGTYAPGSTFKMVTAAAALLSGTITPQTVIDCGGVYTYYAPEYLYHCWIYRDHGITHGPLTAAEALRESCNCFFYEAGRLTGITAIAETARLFGLGEYTGIELSGEVKGNAASADSRSGDWYAGDTLQASIGQSDNLFTPLQLANYIAAIVNGGSHYTAGILSCVIGADGISLFNREPSVAGSLPFTDEIRDTLISGMLAVTEDGTASSVFSDFPVAVLGKSGSAQVSGGSANGIFVLAAPADDPEIAVAVVIEHGASGNNAARVGLDILTAYFGTEGFINDSE